MACVIVCEGNVCRGLKNMDLSVLLKRCCEGDELAWEALVRQFQSRIYGVAYHYVGNAEDARDLAQETFVRIYQNLSVCPDEERFLPWIIRIARNACIDYLRRKKVRVPMQDIDAGDLLSLRAPIADPGELYATDSQKRLVHGALQGMTELNREIILLRDIQGFALEEIASMLQVPVGTVKSRSNRARTELARKLAFLRSDLAGEAGI